jgi:hypothetical protein
MILTLARGHYCPKEHQQHLELAAFYPKIAVAYTRIATIATDDHHTLQVPQLGRRLRIRWLEQVGSGQAGRRREGDLRPMSTATDYDDLHRRAAGFARRDWKEP